MMSVGKSDIKSKVEKVILWTAPRCISTAFERSIRTLKAGKILHEPHSTVYYFGPQRSSSRYSTTPVKTNATYEAVSNELSKEYDGVDFVFVKDMAYYMEGRFDLLRQDGLGDYKHTFLIRNPQKAIPSLYRASTNPEKTDWDYFDPSEAGFRQMLDLYNFIVKEMKTIPVVIDADDVLESPDEMMKKYCSATGLPYDRNMTKWQPGPVPGWDEWPGWYDTVLKSTGFIKKANAKEGQKKSCSFECENEALADAVNEGIRSYQILYEKRLRPDSEL